MSPSALPPPHRAPLTPAAEVIAYLGIVPLVLCPLAIAFLPEYGERLLAQRIAIAWGAVVLASLGGVHWGLALARRLSTGAQRVAGSVFPAVCGAAAVVLGGERGLALLVIALGVFWLYEHRGVGTEIPEDYLRMRRNLTLAGCCLLAITMILSDSVGLL